MYSLGVKLGMKVSHSVSLTNAHCEVCGGSELMVVLPLAPTPLEDEFAREIRNQPLYPVDLTLCKSCGYLHLPYRVSPSESYTDYLYESTVTAGLTSHYDAYADSIVREFALSKESLVVDLGSNDGSMLRSFQRHGVRVLGVEPARRQADAANREGLETICNFFTDSVLADIITSHGSATVITANYMFANVDGLLPFTERVAQLLSQNGVFIVQTGYHPEQFRINMFDYVYHEHFSYFSVEVLQEVFSRSGLVLVNVKSTSPKGGSIRAVATKAVVELKVQASVNSFIATERKIGITTKAYFNSLKGRLDVENAKLLAELRSLRAQGHRIAGFGASHSTTTLIYNFDLGYFLDFIVDDNPLKHGTYSPGKHIPVFGVEELRVQRIKYVVVLAWQHFDVIVARHSDILNYGVTFLRPLPTFSTSTASGVTS